ncbi:hypothetical protein [Deinococcus humi]|uniref:Uncharacterized protein n=1 Tax=Deinococcus humi TaxID=662880 RepID=A0A7W8NFW4_9DEIO|nr:hypothetical protein [Deinococcus humi]MBB5364170.1 hypothetical protein [Deinococcus humi]GGO38660.1 hypothetical protein GCM10008949_45580 [Deinococcus humi]
MTTSDFSANLHSILPPVVTPLTPDFHGDGLFLLGSANKNRRIAVEEVAGRVPPLVNTVLLGGTHGYGLGLGSVDPIPYAVLDTTCHREDWQELERVRAIPATEGAPFHA